MFIPTTLPAELPSNSAEIPVLAGMYVVVAIYCYCLIIIKRNTHTHTHREIKKNNTFLGVTPFFHKSTRRGCLCSARGRQPAQTCKNTAHTHTSSTPRCKRDGEYSLKLMRYACDTTHYGSQTDALCLSGPGPGTILPFLLGRRLCPSHSYSFSSCSISLALTHAHPHPYFVLPS